MGTILHTALQVVDDCGTADAVLASLERHHPPDARERRHLVRDVRLREVDEAAARPTAC
jgi:hypothetical protein